MSDFWPKEGRTQGTRRMHGRTPERPDGFVHMLLAVGLCPHGVAACACCAHNNFLATSATLALRSLSNPIRTAPSALVVRGHPYLRGSGSERLEQNLLSPPLRLDLATQSSLSALVKYWHSLRMLLMWLRRRDASVQQAEAKGRTHPPY